MLVLTRRTSADTSTTATGGEDEIVLLCPGGERIVVKVLPAGACRGTIRIGIRSAAIGDYPSRGD